MMPTKPDPDAPRLAVERAIAGEISWDEIPEYTVAVETASADLAATNIPVGRFRFPHCEARILHAPEDCEYCADAKALQAERAALDVSNTGRTNRKWPCPADRARSQVHQNAWPGNRPQGTRH